MNQKLMKALAELTDLTFDGGDGENRLHYDNERINVYATLMSEKQYDKMETLLKKKQIKGKGYIVSACNDCSGYKYWTRYESDSNYIQITAHITDLNKVDPDQLKKDCEELFNFFESRYNNIEKYFSIKY